jgi:NADH:ubiquinone oxidoreductase subunit 6 (subunit J)
VIQLSYFSILQFSKIPPTFIGFRNLILANGYNDIPLLKSSSSINNQAVYTLIGVNKSLLSNYNVMFGFLFILPLLVGLIGCIILKIKSNKSSIV